MARGKKLTYTFYIGGQKVDHIPEEFSDKLAERFGEAVNDYYSRHPDEYKILYRNLERKKTMGVEP